MNETLCDAMEDSNRIQRLSKLKFEIHRKLISGMDTRMLSMIPPSELVAQIRTAVSQLCHSQGDLLTKSEREQLIDGVVDETLGLGPLEPLIKDPTVSDILINGPDNVYVEHSNG